MVYDLRDSIKNKFYFRKSFVVCFEFTDKYFKHRMVRKSMTFDSLKKKINNVIGAIFDPFSKWRTAKRKDCLSSCVFNEVDYTLPKSKYQIRLLKRNLITIVIAVSFLQFCLDFMKISSKILNFHLVKTYLR